MLFPELTGKPTPTELEAFDQIVKSIAGVE